MSKPPANWSGAELRADAATARQKFIDDRIHSASSEMAHYRAAHARHSHVVRRLLGASKDLRALTGAVLATDREFLNLARYLAVPPISVDDLDALTGSPFKKWLGQKTERGARPSATGFDKAAQLIDTRLDPVRAPWLSLPARKPTPDEINAFVNWVAGIPAAGDVMTLRRQAASARQEAATRRAAADAGYTSAVGLPGNLANPALEMDPGTYSDTSRKLRNANMDVPIRLRGGHRTGLDFLAVECKVSNSEVNSKKRLAEVLQKRDTWDKAGPSYRFRTAAVLAGLFDVSRLEQAQSEGVIIFWEHRLDDLTGYLR